MSSILKRSQFLHWDTMTEVNVRTGGINSQLDTHWRFCRRQQFIQAQMDRLNQADLENLYYATQPCRGGEGELVEAVEGELVLPSNRRLPPTAWTLRHTRNLIICYTLHKVKLLLHSLAIFSQLSCQTTIVAKLTAFVRHQIYALL